MCLNVTFANNLESDDHISRSFRIHHSCNRWCANEGLLFAKVKTPGGIWIFLTVVSVYKCMPDVHENEENAGALLLFVTVFVQKMLATLK